MPRNPANNKATARDESQANRLAKVVAGSNLFPMNSEKLQTILNTLEGVKQLSEDKYQACCPAHDDNKPSLSISEGADGRILLFCHRGCETTEILQALNLEYKDLYLTNGQAKLAKQVRVQQSYDYTDKNGKPLYQVRRYSDKSFSQHKTDGHSGWMNKLYDARKVLYQLPQLANASSESFIYICEGEKDVDRLIGEGLFATTNSGGASNWGKTDSTPLHDHHIILLEDNDLAGRKRVGNLAVKIIDVVKSARILALPDLPKDGGDVSDWLNAGNDVEDLDSLAVNTPLWEPSLDKIATDIVCQNRLWQSFPVDELPTPLRDFVTEGAKATGVDEAMYALPVLCSVASAIGSTRRLRIKRNWNVPAILWGVVIAKSGSNKTAPFNDATRPMHKQDSQSIKEYEKVLAEHEVVETRYKADFKRWEREAASSAGASAEPPTKPSKPTMPRLVISDTTVEAVAALLSDNHRGLLLARDELSGWLTSFNAYRNGRGGDCASWIGMYHCERTITDRKGGGSGDRKLIVCEHSAVSICGTIQPKIARRALTDELFESGLAARVLMIDPPIHPKVWSDSDMSSTTEYSYESVFEYLLSLHHYVDSEGIETPKDICFSPEAKKIFIKFWERHGQLQNENEDERIGAAFAKLEEVAARLALIFHYVLLADEDPRIEDPDLVGVVEIEAAIKITNWFIFETERVYTLFDDDEETAKSKMLLEWVQLQGGSVTVRQVMSSNRRKYPTSELANYALRELVERGYGSWDWLNSGPKGGRPIELFVAESCAALNGEISRL